MRKVAMRVLASLTVLLIANFTAALAADDALMKQAQATFEPIPLQPPSAKDGVTTPARIELGKALFFDPRLSLSHNISCNTCHQIGLAGVDALPTSIGHKSQRGAGTRQRSSTPCSIRRSFGTAARQT
jgi:cytochrome c peroxidase